MRAVPVSIVGDTGDGVTYGTDYNGIMIGQAMAVYVPTRNQLVLGVGSPVASGYNVQGDALGLIFANGQVYNTPGIGNGMIPSPKYIPGVCDNGGWLQIWDVTNWTRIGHNVSWTRDGDEDGQSFNRGAYCPNIDAIVCNDGFSGVANDKLFVLRWA